MALHFAVQAMWLLFSYQGADASPLLSSGQVLHLARSPEMFQYLTRVRRQLHTHPELSFKEEKTSAFLRQELDSMGIKYLYPIATTGISALIGDGSPPIIALRADMDALPIQEPSDLDSGRLGFKSEISGAMHACGHDAHMAMLLGAARIISALQHPPNTSTPSTSSSSTGRVEWPGIAGLKGSVVLVFQPAEESQGGARHVIEEGGLQGAQAVSGLHVWPSYQRGTLGTRKGPIMAASSSFVIRVKGRGGHGAMPHLAADPVVAASAAVLALQTIVSRETSPTDGAVVTVARMNTGPGAANVIPDEVELAGTIRSLTPGGFDHLKTRVEEVVRGTAAVYGCQLAKAEWRAQPYPPTINDPVMAEMALDIAKELSEYDMLHPSSAPPSSLDFRGISGSDEGAPSAEGGWGEVVALEAEHPSMAAEDFSYYGQKVPSVFSWLGTGDAVRGTDAALHNPRFQVDETQLPLGAAYHVSVALQYLQTHQSSEQIGNGQVGKDEL